MYNNFSDYTTSTKTKFTTPLLTYLILRLSILNFRILLEFALNLLEVEYKIAKFKKKSEKFKLFIAAVMNLEVLDQMPLHQEKV